MLTHIRLWKIIDGEQYEFAESVTGLLDTIVSPGSYVVKAFSMGVELASEEFEIAHLEQKNITLTVETIYFKSFAGLWRGTSTQVSRVTPRSSIPSPTSISRWPTQR